LIFGSRSSSEGLFHDEIKEFQEQGVLTKAFMCYSREKDTKKEYTHGKLYSIEIREILGPILADPTTHIFMCGSANMAEDCKISLCAISSQDLFDSIIEDGRLHCDVFGALLPQRTHVSKRKTWSPYLRRPSDLV
jgi:sulfite reductase alpha subunit-like flavoprotein